MISKKSIIFLLLLMFVFAFSTTPLYVSADSLVTVDSLRVWDLKDLGYGELTLSCQENTETVSIQYILPDNAAQGPENWYILHFNFVIQFSEQSEPGRCYVTAAANNYTCAQIMFETQREEGVLKIDYNTVDLMNGYNAWTTDARTIFVSFSNYLTVTGVKSGTNIMTFAVETYEGIDVTAIRILPSSGIEFTSMSPPDLKLDIMTLQDPPKVGEDFILGFKLKNIGDMPAKGVVVRVIYPMDALELIGPGYCDVDELDTVLEGQFQFEALKVGQHSLIVDVQTDSGIKRPSARLVLLVSERSSYFPMGAVAASIVFGCLVMYVVIARRGKYGRSVRR